MREAPSLRTCGILPILLAVAWFVGSPAEAGGREWKYEGKTVAEWTADLKASDSSVRQKAALHFSSIGSDADPALPALIAALGDPQAAVRQAAASSLGLIQVRMRSESPWRRMPEAAVPALVRLLKDPDSYVRGDAARAVGHFGPAAKSAVSALVEILTDLERTDKSDPKRVTPEFLLRISVVRSLGEIGPDARAGVPVLVRALADPGFSTQAARALGGMGPAAAESLPALRAMFDDTAKSSRFSAADALYAVGRDAKETLPFLLSSLEDADPDARESAAVSIGQLGPDGAAAIEPLIRACKDAEAHVRAQAARALGPMTAGSTRAVPALLATLADPAPRVRLFAAEALGIVGPAAKDAAGALRAALRSPPDTLGTEAALALWRVTGEVAPIVPYLVEAIRGSDKPARKAAIDALGSMGRAAAAAEPVLVKVAEDDEDSLIRDWAKDALARIRSS